MNKELGNFMRVSSIALFLAGCEKIHGSGLPDVPVKASPALVRVPTDTPTVSATPDFIEVYTPNPTPTPEIIPTPEVKTFIRENIDFGKEGPITLTFAEPIKKDISANIAVYPEIFSGTADATQTDNILQKNWFNEHFYPGQGTIVSEKDNLGNVAIFIHDGYLKGKSLEAESIRSYIEGYKEKTINDVDHIKITMQSLVGTKIDISQEDNSSQFIITAIVQIPPDQVAFYDSDIKNIFENAYLISQDANKTDGATDIIENYVKTGQGTAISICGWGIVDGKIYSSQTRYVIFFEPKSDN